MPSEELRAAAWLFVRVALAFGALLLGTGLFAIAWGGV